MQRVVVVGAGVVGLTCAVRLAETGHQVDVLARDLPAETTSAVACGLWLPSLVEPVADVVRWARATHAELLTLTDDDRTGVRMMPGQVLRRRAAAEPAWFAPLHDLVDPQPVAQPPVGWTRSWATTLPLVDTGRYLPYLVGRLKAAGGSVTRLPLAALPGRGVVVNCTGVAARMLAADPSVHPVSGQIVVLDDPGLTHWWCDEDGADGDLTFVVPRGRDLVVGGTLADGVWDTTPDPRTASAILARAGTLVPGLATLPVRAHRVGLRPARPSVRVEVEERTDDDGRPSPVVHCYGHGGIGLSVAWGCADEVLRLVGQLTGSAPDARLPR